MNLLRPLLILLCALLALSAAGCDNGSGEQGGETAETSQTAPQDDVDTAEEDPELEQLNTRIENVPEDASAHRDRARLYRQRGDKQKALTDLRRAVELEPDNYEHRLELSSLLIDLQHYTEAREQLDEAARIEPDDPNLLRARATLHWHMLEYAEAKQIYRGILQDAPGLTGALRALIKVELADGGPPVQESLGEVLENYIEASPNSAAAHWELGVQLQQAGELDAAEQHFQQSREANPDDPRLYWTLGLIDSERENYRDAAEHFLTGLELIAESGSDNLDARPLRRVRLEMLRKAGDYETALETVERMLEETPADTYLQLERADLRRELGETAQAEGTVERIRELHPEKYHLWRASRELERENYAAAMEQLQQVEDFNPESGGLPDSRFRTLMELEDFAGAASEAERELDAGAGGRWNLLRARALAQEGKLEEARRECLTALRSERGMALLTLLPEACQPPGEKLRAVRDAEPE